MNTSDIDFLDRMDSRTEALLDVSNFGDLGKDLDGKDDAAVVRTLRREVAELRQQLALLNAYRNMAYRDFLTGALNRRAFEERLREECARANRSGTHKCALILADVDDLKIVNDTFGHTAGDEVLIDVARFLAENIREIDHAYRLGGDEFAVLLPDADDAGCRVVMARLEKAFSEARSRFSSPVGLSVGCAALDGTFTEPQTLIERADTEMYLAKRAKKMNRCTRGMSTTP